MFKDFKSHLSLLYIQVLLSLVSICMAAPFSTMDSDAEHIHAYNGFYGNPIYRWRIKNNVCQKEVLNYCEISDEILSKRYLIISDLMALVRGDSDRQDLERRCWRPAGQTPSMEDIPRIKNISKTFCQNCYFLNDDGILCARIGMGWHPLQICGQDKNDSNQVPILYSLHYSNFCCKSLEIIRWAEIPLSSYHYSPVSIFWDTRHLQNSLLF